MVAVFANKLMREGTKQKSSLAINEILDFYGCNLEEQSYFSNAGFQLYSLSRNIHQVLPLMKEMLTEAAFPESEFELLRSNRKEKHLQRLAKNDYLANRLFLSNMWGKTHPYGRVTELENFDDAGDRCARLFLSTLSCWELLYHFSRRIYRCDH